MFDRSSQHPQIFGWPLYLITNASGQRRYPKGTNRTSPIKNVLDCQLIRLLSDQTSAPLPSCSQHTTSTRFWCPILASLSGLLLLACPFTTSGLLIPSVSISLLTSGMCTLTGKRCEQHCLLEFVIQGQPLAHPDHVPPTHRPDPPPLPCQRVHFPSWRFVNPRP